MDNFDIFVSYRRDGGEALACLISERLKQREFSVFYDVESLRSGKFNEKIFSVIDNCTDVIVVLPQNGLDRCVNEDDWVRKEIAHAIKAKKKIIPIMMRNFEFPKVLPEDIDDIRNYNGVSANMEYFEASFEKLLSMLDSAKTVPFEKIKRLTSDEALQNEFIKCIEAVKTKNTSDAKYNLAECYRKLGNQTYNEEMAKLYMQAADSGHADAQCAMGACYENSLGVGKNIEKAIEWYKLSADQGCASAQFHIAKCYHDYADELYQLYLKKASEQNDPDVLYNLAKHYVNEGDFESAKPCFERAAKLGHPKAMNTYAKALYKGGNHYTNNDDYNTAKSYFEEAATLGHEEAKKKINSKFKKFCMWAYINRDKLLTAGCVVLLLLALGFMILMGVLDAKGIIDCSGFTEPPKS